MKRISATFKAPTEAFKRFQESFQRVSKQLKQFGEIMPVCPDCKDGYYYPLNGPKEPCQTCSNTQNLTKALANAAPVRMSQAHEKQAEDRIHRVPVGAPIANELKKFFEKETVEAMTIQPSLSRIPTKPVEYAKQIKRFLERNPSITIYDLAERISKSASYLYQCLDLLKLKPATQALIDKGQLTMSEAIDNYNQRKAEKLHYYAAQAASFVGTQEEKDAIWGRVKAAGSYVEPDAYQTENGSEAAKRMNLQGTSAMISKSSDCTDCSDGFYYPLSGPREVCQTCGGGIETATKNLHKALADQVFLRQAEGRYARTPVSEVNVEVTPPNDAELKRLLESKSQAMDEYTKGKNAVFQEIYGGPLVRDYTIKDLIEKGLDTEQAIKVFNKLECLKQRPHNRGGLVPKGVAFDVETNGQVNLAKASYEAGEEIHETLEAVDHRRPLTPTEYSNQLEALMRRKYPRTGRMASTQPSFEVLQKGQFLEPIYGDKADAAVAAQNALNHKAMEKMTTDWAKYLPAHLKGRAALIRDVILRDEDKHQKDIVKTVVTQFFKLSTCAICECVEERKTVTVAHLAATITEFSNKRQEIREAYKENYLSKKALKENGFSPTL